MDPAQLVAVAAAGLAAGAVNTIAGAGSLITFPVLVAIGLTPLTANVTNDLGVIPGNASGALGFRAELRGQGPRMRLLLPITAVGSLLGGVLLLAFPAKAFQVVAPVLLLLASIVTLAQPALARRAQASEHAGERRTLLGLIGAIALYGGYFGTGIGVLFFAALGVFVDDDPRRLNATKQILQLVSNGVAGVLFIFIAHIDWAAVLVLGISSAAGGPVGAKASRFVSARTLRIVVSIAGAAAAVYLAIRQL